MIFQNVFEGLALSNHVNKVKRSISYFKDKMNEPQSAS